MGPTATVRDQALSLPHPIINIIPIIIMDTIIRRVLAPAHLPIIIPIIPIIPIIIIRRVLAPAPAPALSPGLRLLHLLEHAPLPSSGAAMME